MPIRLRVAIIVLLLHFNLMATTVVYIVTPEGIVIGADSKFVRSSLGGKISTPLPEIRKIAVVHNRLVVASIGTDISEVWGKKENKIVFPTISKSGLLVLRRSVRKTCPYLR
jgi:hypothetical protein